MNRDYMTDDEAKIIQKELLSVLRKYELNSGLSIALLKDTVEYIAKYSNLPD